MEEELKKVKMFLKDKEIIGAKSFSLSVGLIHIDKKDGTGGFVIPDDENRKDIIEELLKNPEYIIREAE